MEDRIVRLEEKITHIEKTVGDLSGVVAELNRQLTALRGEWRDVRAQAGETDPTRGPEDDRPPHWGPPKE